MKTKVSKPVIWMIAGMSVLWGLNSLNAGIYYSHPLSFVYAVMGLAGGVGLFLQLSWSQYLIYGSAAVVLSSWFIASWMNFGVTYPYETLSLTIIGALIALPLPLLCIGGSYLVYRYFNPGGGK